MKNACSAQQPKQWHQNMATRACNMQLASKHTCIACLSTPLHPTHPFRRQAAPNGKRHKLRQNAFFTRQNEKPRATQRSDAISSGYLWHRRTEGWQGAGKGGGINPLVLQRGRQSQHQSSRRQSVESKCLMSEEEGGLQE